METRALARTPGPRESSLNVGVSNFPGFFSPLSLMLGRACVKLCVHTNVQTLDVTCDWCHRGVSISSVSLPETVLLFSEEKIETKRPGDLIQGSLSDRWDWQKKESGSLICY